ncbi:MAG: LytTR family DNA-binding domain-containing protein [Bacteroidales bacterium]
MIKCIAIDDEPLALTQISNYIKKTPFLDLCASFGTGVSAMEYLHHNQIDLMFVDIQMPDMTGMELVKVLDKAPKIIFTTAYSEYAAEGFKVEALDYLLKPLDYTTFLKSANKARSYFEKEEIVNNSVNNPVSKFVNNSTNDSENSKSYIFVKSEYKIVRVELSDILFLESMREYINIHLTNGKSIMTLSSMKKIEGQLPEDKFMRVHRSYIVNLERVKIIERNVIIFDDVRIPVSDQYKEDFQKYINKRFL